MQKPFVLLYKKGFDIVSGGTDCHMVLRDLERKSYKRGWRKFDRGGITCNKNSVPFDKQSPFVTSGIRVGTAAGTTRGFKEDQFEFIAECISKIIDALTTKNKEVINNVETEVLEDIKELCKKFPIYQ